MLWNQTPTQSITVSIFRLLFSVSMGTINTMFTGDWVYDKCGMTMCVVSRSTASIERKDTARSACIHVYIACNIQAYIVEKVHIV